VARGADADAATMSGTFHQRHGADAERVWAAPPRALGTTSSPGTELSRLLLSARGLGPRHLHAVSGEIGILRLGPLVLTLRKRGFRGAFGGRDGSEGRARRS
jgi:hypothetical protein